jgi:hypothetical protein
VCFVTFYELFLGIRPDFLLLWSIFLAKANFGKDPRAVGYVTVQRHPYLKLAYPKVYVVATNKG